MLLPLATLVLKAAAVSGGALGHIVRNVLAAALVDTGLLLLGVGGLVLLIGGGAAIAVALFEFPGRRALSFALVLPLAVPTYLAAYAFVDALDYFGPVQGAIREIFGFRSRRDYWFPDVRSMGGAITVTALVLYPYVYLAGRAALALQSGSLIDAARMLGASRSGAVIRIALPLVLPAILAGCALALLETLNDIGATQYLGVQTLTVAVFTTWLIRGDLAGASFIALAMIALVAALAAVAGREQNAASPRQARAVTRRHLPGWRGWIVSAACALPVIGGFGIPFLTLLREGVAQAAREGIPADLLPALGNTALVGALATAVLIGTGLALGLAVRFARGKMTEGAARAARLGYAIPGTVLVIGLLPVFGWVDAGWNRLTGLGALLSGTYAALVLAYAIRFLAVANGPVRHGLAATSTNIDSAALILGESRRGLSMRILVPAISPAIAAAAIAVFVDVIKELPATLLLRPLNVETLATTVYGHAARGSFEDGALAALLIMLAGLVPLLALDRAMDGYRHAAA